MGAVSRCAARDFCCETPTTRRRTPTGTTSADRLDQSQRRVAAFIPDPLDSHLVYEFGAELAALRQAYEVSGYTIDRFWLPWTLDRQKTELSARNNRIDTIAYRHRFPGFILFRDITNTKLRVLYVLGEVPTSGMNATAFERALADRKAILAV